MTVPAPRAHDPAEERDAEGSPIEPTEPSPAHPPIRYPLTQAYLALMVTLILLAVVFEWRW